MSAASYAVELKELRKSFGKTEIIRGANLAVRSGERVAVIGPNGAGKSTLFNLVSGRFGPSSGEILLNGERVDGMMPYEINRRGLARSFQITNIFGHLSHDRLHRRGAAHAVTPEEAHDLALAHVHVDTVQDVALSVVRVDVGELQQHGVAQCAGRAAPATCASASTEPR